MKIDYCDEYDNVIVRLNKWELSLITGYTFGDRYGNQGKAFNKDLIGKEFDLRALEETRHAIKVAHEFKDLISEKLVFLSDTLVKDINFFTPEITKESEE